MILVAVITEEARLVQKYKRMRLSLLAPPHLLLVIVVFGLWLRERTWMPALYLDCRRCGLVDGGHDRLGDISNTILDNGVFRCRKRVALDVSFADESFVHTTRMPRTVVNDLQLLCLHRHHARV